MTFVADCSPVRVFRFGNVVLVKLASTAEAVALRRALDDGRLVQENPAEFHRRYAEEYGIPLDTTATTD